MTTPSAKIVSFLKPKRTWLQYRLRTMFVLVVIAAVPCVWLKSKMNQKQKERAAVAEVVRIGGQVVYDWQVANEQEPPGATWLRNLLGENFFARVVMVDLVIRRIDNVKCEIHMKSVSSEVTDHWLVTLEPLTDLEDVHLAGKQISDTGLVHLVNLTRLKELSLAGTGVADKSLMTLASLPNFVYLRLFGKTNVTDAGIAELQKALPNCKIKRFPEFDAWIEDFEHDPE